MFDRETKTLSSSHPTSQLRPSHRHLAGKSRRPKKREWIILIISAGIKCQCQYGLVDTMDKGAWPGLLSQIVGKSKLLRRRAGAGAESDKNQPGV